MNTRMLHLHETEFTLSTMTSAVADSTHTHDNVYTMQAAVASLLVGPAIKCNDSGQTSCRDLLVLLAAETSTAQLPSLTEGSAHKHQWSTTQLNGLLIMTSIKLSPRVLERHRLHSNVLSLNEAVTCHHPPCYCDTSQFIRAKRLF